MKSATSLFSILAVPAPANGRAATTFLNKLLLPGLSILLAYFCVSAHAQSGQWTWVGGSNTIGVNGGQSGVYGTLGVPAAGNFPGSRTLPVSWTGKDGRLWLFGGGGYDSAGNNGDLNDLWVFNPSTNEWTWMAGSNTIGPNCDPNGGQCGQSAVFGTLGTPAAGNTPGGLSGASGWTDSSGNLWLFGGQGYIVPEPDNNNGLNNFGGFNDLWEFSPSTNEWAWMGGSATPPPGGGQPGVYGTLGTPAAGNIPGGRNSAASWTDSGGHFWLFGGGGADAGSNGGYLNDLWEFNPSTNQWAWMGGSSAIAIQPANSGVYGTLGTPSPGNSPGGRLRAANSIDSKGNLWLFGGWGQDSAGNSGDLNDVWEFNPSTNEWTWMGGSSTMTLISPGNGYGQPGVYGTLDTFAAGDIPGGRWPGTSWTDNGGHLWLFGGLGKDTGNDNGGFLNDLWELNPTTNEWAWMGGSSIPNQPGVYGTSGTPSAGNIPGARWFSTTWTDSSGHLWLFGGGGFDANGNWGSLGDLWEFQPFATASTPTFSLAAGTYTSIQTVTIADSTPGAIIYYTLDGSTPTTASALYSKALTISQTTTINAIAIATGYSNSAVATATYILNLPPSTAPGFTPAAGTYTTVEKVKITDSMKGASIYYTLDGSTPTIASAKYTAAISVNQTTTINAIAVATGYSSSSVASAVYIITIAAAPTFTPTAGEYGQAQWVTLASATPNPTIYYTTDGSTPSESSTQYTGPIAVSATTTIKAIATAIGYTGSPVVSAKFTLVSSPNVLTGLASGIATPAATLNATVHDFDSAGQVWFLWGTNSTALNSSTEKVALPALSGAQSVSAPLTGLAGGTTYYFQPVASTVGGTSYGAIQSFTTN
jgi:N-acetylneuraminic acid mutarotase